MGGLNDWLSNIIPNELKGNLGKIALAAGAAYYGYKGFKYGLPKTSEYLFGTPGMTAAPYASGTKGKIGFGGFMESMSTIGETFDKYKDNPLVKFGKGMVGTTVGKGGEPDTKAQNDMYLAQMRALETRYTANKFSGSPVHAGQFQATQISSPGFSNNRVQESLSSMAAYMADLQDNGRIDSSALYAEGPKGTTLKLSSSNLKSLQSVG